MISLDSPAVLAAGDPGSMLAAVEGAADQWAEGLARARAADLRPAESPASVVVCGMGGSGIAGDVLASVASVPVLVCKGYDPPASLGPGSLALCVSYSGNTEETLACFEAALARGARGAVVSTGGALADRARAAGVPRVSPVEGLQPRAALPSLAAITLAFADRAGVLPDGALARVEQVLREGCRTLGRGVPEDSNLAKRLARALDGLVPLVWGQEGPLAVAATRWRCQLNENAKLPAFSSVLPELDHNEIAGYSPGHPALSEAAIVVLRSPGEHPGVVRRIGATLATVGPRVGRVEEAWASGETPLARLLSSALLGDFVSVYLALLRGVDPTPVEAIERLKRDLAR